MEGGIVFRRYRGISFSVAGGASYSDVPEVSLSPFGGGHGVPMSPRYPFSDGRGHRVPMSPLYPFSVGGGHIFPMYLRHVFFRQVGNIVFRCSHGIFFLFGGGHHVPMSPLYPFFHFGGGMVFRCSDGIPFSLEGRHRVTMSFRYPFSVGGGASGPDVSAVSLFRFGGGASCPDVFDVPLTLWREGIVYRCPRGIPFPLTGGHRVPMSPRYRFSIECKSIVSRCLYGISRFHQGGGEGIVSRYLHGIPFTSGGEASCPDFLALLFFRWGRGNRIPVFPRCPFFVEGGASYSFVSTVSLFRLRVGIVFRCSHGIPFPLEGGIVFRCSRGISFPLGGASHSDVPAVSLLVLWGHCIPIFLWYPFSFGGGGHRVSMCPRYPFFRPGGGIVSPCLSCIPFSVWGGHRIPIFPRYPFFRWGGCVLFRCSHGILFPVGGGYRIPMFPRYASSVGRGASYSDVPAVCLFSAGRGASYFDVLAISLSQLEGGHRLPMFSPYPFSGGGRYRVPMSPRYPFSVGGGVSYPDVSAVSIFLFGGCIVF